MTIKTGTLLLAVCGAASTLTASQAPTIVESYVRARATVDAAVAAHGGAAALTALHTARIAMDGDQYWRHQSRRPDPPYDREAERYELLLDLPKGRLISARWATYPGGAHRYTGFITDGARGFSVNFRQGTHSVATYPPAGEQTGHLHNLPQFVLADVAAGGRSLRSLGRLTLTTGVEVEAVSALVRGSLLTVGFDLDTRRLRAVLNVGNDLIEGDSAAEVEFVDYAMRGGVLMPARRIVRSSAGVLRDARFETVEPGYAIPAHRLSPPAGSVDVTAQVTPEPVRVVAPGVWTVGGGSAALVVEFPDHVLVVDAPPGSADVLSRISTLAAKKPARFVIPTHHHDDHSGGLGVFARAGATVVTTRGNQKFMGHLVRDVPQSKVELLVGDVRVFEAGGRRVEIQPDEGQPARRRNAGGVDARPRPAVSVGPHRRGTERRDAARDEQ